MGFSADTGQVQWPSPLWGSVVRSANNSISNLDKPKEVQRSCGWRKDPDVVKWAKLQDMFTTGPSTAAALTITTSNGQWLEVEMDKSEKDQEEEEDEERLGDEANVTQQGVCDAD